MPSIGQFSNAASTRQDFPLGKGACWAGTILRDPTPEVSPHAFYVFQEPHSVAERHYHDACQFQVVVHGGGSLGSHDVSPFAVHYAAFQTVYGPLTAGPDGLGYMTLRIQEGVGVRFWPQTKDRMIQGVRRGQAMAHATVEPNTETGAVTELIASEASGLAARNVRVAPGAAIDLRPEANSAGLFCLLAAGEASLDDVGMALLDVAWINRGEASSVRAGEDGAQVIIMQMPIEALQDKARLESATV